MNKLEIIKNYSEATRQIQEIGHITTPDRIVNIHFTSHALISIAYEFDKKCKVERFNDRRYPYEVSIVIEGIRLYAIFTENEAIEYGLIKEETDNVI